jgi:iron complex outermembrane recepter protein
MYSVGRRVGVHIRRRAGISISFCARCSLFGVLGSVAFAQEAATAPESTPAGDGTQLQEVVVTAQFRSQNLQQTPLAITAVNAEMMEARGEHTVLDTVTHVPSVTFATGGQGGPQTTAVTIRGIGQTDFNLAVEPGVGMYVDDVYYGTIYGSMFKLLDLDRVEVLRGPQGTLSGKNSEGGAMKLYAKQPSDSGGGYLEATYGSFNRREFRGGANFTLVPDKLFVRVTGLSQASDGYVKRYDYRCFTGQPPLALGSPGSFAPGGTNGCQIGTDGGVDVTAFRVALRYLATDSTQDTLSYDTTIDRSESAPNVLIYQGTWHGTGYNLLSNPPVTNLAANFVPPYGSYYNFSTYTGLAGTPWQYTNSSLSPMNAWGVSNVLDVGLPASLSLKSISAVRHLDLTGTSDSDASPLSRLMNLWNVKYTQYSQELLLSGNVESWLDWTVGGFYFKYSAIQGGRISLDGAGDNSIPFFTTTDFLFRDPVHVESKSGFAHTEFHATDVLTFTAGIRYTNDYKRYDYTRDTAPGYPPSIIDQSITPLNGATGTFRGGRVDYRATADYRLAGNASVYFEYATGFKGGGVNPRPYYLEQVQPFRPETVDSYELGWKSELLDHRIRLNADVFYNKYNDMQLVLLSCPQFVPPGAPQNCFMPENVGKATIKGAELETELHLSRNLLVDASASYVDFHYDSVNPATGLTLQDKTPFTPKYQLVAGAQYSIPLGKSGSVIPRVDYRYLAEQYAYALNAPHNLIPAYGLLDARLTYRDADDKWELSLQGTNLTNRYYYLNVTDQSPPVTGTYQLTSVDPGSPREYSITLRRSL